MVKYTVQEFHGGKVITISIYFGAESLATYLLKKIGLEIDFKKASITVQVSCA